jgi:type IV pilus assembly protein PilY1
MKHKYKRPVVIIMALFLCIAGLMMYNALADQPALNPAGGNCAIPLPLSSGNVGTVYNGSLTASGCGNSLFNWTISSGSLPQGLDWSTGGVRNSVFTISGTPRTDGSYKFKIRVSSDGCSIPEKGWYSLVINPATDLIITTPGLPGGLPGIPYSATVTAENGLIPYTWAVTSGALPPGLVLVSGTPSATINGTPATEGSYTFTLTVTDGISFDSQEFTIDISVLQIISISPLPSGNEGQPYSVIIEGQGGSGSYTWDISDGVPDGLNLVQDGSPAAMLSGTPIESGDFTFTITLEDGVDTVIKNFSVYIEPSDLAICTLHLDPDTVDVCSSYSATVTATGGTGSYTWGITAGLMPEGLFIAPTGTPSTAISGVPSEAGLFNFTVTVTDSSGVSRSDVFGIDITGSATSCEPDILDYTAYPPFVLLSGVKPNILLTFDNSGSMNEFAYKDAGFGGSRDDPDTSYDPNTSYYGYFDDVNYSYSDSGGYFYADSSGGWNGSFLNWLTMRRIDIVRKVLIGGKVEDRDTGTEYIVAVESPDRNTWKSAFGQTYHVYQDSNDGSPYQIIKVCTDGNDDDCDDSRDGPDYNIRIRASGEITTGLIHDYEDRINFGLMFFNEGDDFEGGLPADRDGGYIASPVGADFSEIVTNIETTDPDTWTPLGETAYEAIRFYQAGNSAYNPGVSYSDVDPLANYCQDNFIMILTDGESTKDRNIPGSNFGPTVSDSSFNVCTYMDLISVNEVFPVPYPDRCGDDADANSYQGTYFLEGVSYYSHINDLRPDPDGQCPDAAGVFDIDCGFQNITTYTVYAFDDSPVGKELLQRASKYGGFEDIDGDGKPFTNASCTTDDPDNLCREWDKDRNHIPDTYFEAQEGRLIQKKIQEAFEAALEKTSSGTSAAVLSTTGEGEGAVYQAYFVPEPDNQVDVSWIGYLQGLFIDKWGNLREDSFDPTTETAGDNKLCLDADDPIDFNDPDGEKCGEADAIIQMAFDQDTRQTIIKRFPGNKDDLDENGNPIGVPVEVAFEAMQKIWEAGELLWSSPALDRTIYTSVDGTAGSRIDFSAVNRSNLRPLLRAGTDDEAEAIIKFIRGEDNPVVNGFLYNYRTRTMEIGGVSNVWKLGDIIYSTPIAVSKPAEDYDLIYKDGSYAAFSGKYRHRRHVVYSGANDGMLHALNAGFYDSNKLKFCDEYESPGVCPDNDTGVTLGKELWGFISQSLLPHLKWLTQNDYTHVYFNDLRPKVVDARIFTEEGDCDPENNDFSAPGCIHPRGWGTVLIQGMRFGGRDISYQDSTWPVSRTFRSAYFALDITDPERPPELLWTIPVTSGANPGGLPGLGLTTSRPAVLRTGADVLDKGTWYAVFGSGPDAEFDSYNGMSARSASIYVVNLATGELAKTISDISIGPNSFMGDPITVDVNLNDKVDSIYIGNVLCETGPECTSSNWKGKMFRITTAMGDDNPDNWNLNVFYDAGQPITAAPSITLDNVGDLWLYFGTGRYYSLIDAELDDSERWSFYGLKDRCQSWIEGVNLTTGVCSEPVLKADLLDASNIVVKTDETLTGSPGGEETFSELEEKFDTDNYEGWFIDFANAGERSLFKPGLLGGIVAWSSFSPVSDDVCALGGFSRLYASFYKTGTAYKRSVIGLAEDSETVLRESDIGKGIASSPSFSVSGEKEAKIILHMGGRYIESEEITVYPLKSGVSGWRTARDGSGISECN